MGDSVSAYNKVMESFASGYNKVMESPAARDAIHRASTIPTPAELILAAKTAEAEGVAALTERIVEALRAEWKPGKTVYIETPESASVVDAVIQRLVGHGWAVSQNGGALTISAR